MKGSLSLYGFASLKGSKSPSAKLDDAGVLRLRAAKSDLEVAAIASEYKITLAYADSVRRRKKRNEEITQPSP